VVDYTLPSAVNENAEFYCANALPFVMGTTGGDREALLASVAAAGRYAVIAPNMGKQIVAFQARQAGAWFDLPLPPLAADARSMRRPITPQTLGRPPPPCSLGERAPCCHCFALPSPALGGLAWNHLFGNPPSHSWVPRCRL
jgi:hypothetical protein